MNDVHAANTEGNEFYARTLESFTTFRDSVRAWHRQGEYAFENFVYGQEEGQQG